MTLINYINDTLRLSFRYFFLQNFAKLFLTLCTITQGKYNEVYNEHGAPW